MATDRDDEANRLTGRIARYARVGTGVGGVAARMIGAKAFGREIDKGNNAAELARALGGLKGPIMKVAQLLSTIPDAVPPEYAAELAQLQSNAPPMGWVFVKRRMMAELGAGWQSRFGSFEKEPAAAASLGQVHRAQTLDGAAVACKLQYPDMASAVEADISQLRMILSLHRRMSSAIDTREIGEELGERVREELDYRREAKHIALYREILGNEPLVRVPDVYPELSTGRLLTMSWMPGRRLLDFTDHSLEERNRIATAMFRAWWHPFCHFAVIHGDPHLGNYTVFEDGEGSPQGINLLDYGCIRIFRPEFVQGVIDLYRGIETNDRDRIVAAYESWGFRGLNNDLVDILNVWARFIYGPLLEDRVRAIAEGISPAEYGRKQAFQVHQALKEKGPVTIPREFVFMDRAAVGLGGVFLHLRAEMNFYRLFNEEIEAFELSAVKARQAAALRKVDLPLP
ncbi:Predicted unusual protein kinase regulating ubiquinone biosynthesis, AarF/ABC1/UbiB family [Faunimonas pinastri]|uniref:Predicted unusual protein kinase regulating ubiquinone biosynthesis, AarF/ABC1/UbiB family n=1 Tax=Faunimonas pinastri TaxID=1855383 RepID=A0A1H8Z369_9HYPH|nr:AarF/UbiB family protein [Faunimonas pinastri]SEP58781.1 Predicted unusual protein kinase regulating ubiquinone biosynthesis, AarF/ABC1/UbiB family [Faunimonas pinastri]